MTKNCKEPVHVSDTVEPTNWAQNSTNNDDHFQLNHFHLHAIGLTAAATQPRRIDYSDQLDPNDEGLPGEIRCILG